MKDTSWAPSHYPNHSAQIFLSIGPSGIKCNGILIVTISCKKMNLKMVSVNLKGSHLFQSKCVNVWTHWAETKWLVFRLYFEINFLVWKWMYYFYVFKWKLFPRVQLTHWGRVTHICVGKLSIIGSDNGLSPNRRQAIIWTNAGILLIGTQGTNFSEISIEMYTFSFRKMHLKVSSGKWRPCCLGLNELTVNQHSFR